MLHMITDALGGAVAGLIAGLFFGLVIKYLTLLVSPALSVDGPGIVAPFLGMGLGTLTGAVFGALVGLKKS